MFRLAQSFGEWNVRKFLRRLPCSLFVDWMEFNQIEPFGFPALDYCFARSDVRYMWSLISKKDTHKYKSKITLANYLYAPPDITPEDKAITKHKKNMAFGNLLKSIAKKQ